MIRRIGILFVAALASAETTMVVVGKVGTEVLEARLSNAPLKKHLEELRIKHSKSTRTFSARCPEPARE
jgi:hypothetical protein